MGKPKHEVDITMLGPSRVGKTSLLTSMASRFDETVGAAHLRLTPDPESAALLGQRLAELRGMLDRYEIVGGIPGDEVPRSYVFDLGQRGAAPSLRLRFQDYPGGTIANTDDVEDKQFVKDILYLYNCVAVLVAIDAPALMEHGGIWHEQRNHATRIANLFQHAYSGLREPRLVILAPVKCEKYMATEQGQRNLLKRVREGYADLLSAFNQDDLRPHVAVVVTPVQTVGGIVLSRIEGDPEYIPHFRKAFTDAAFEPRDCDQPLRYLLRFLLTLHIQKLDHGVWSIIRRLRKADRPLVEAAEAFAQGCKDDDGFAVLQGQDWLRPSRN